MRLIRKLIRVIRAIGGSLRKRSYAERRRSELETYSRTQNVHELPQIAHYWSEKYLIPKLAPFGFRNCIECFRSYIAGICHEKAPSTVFVLSVGAGDSATEINIAEWLRENSISNYRFECLDLNPDVLRRGKASAKAKGLDDRFSFASFDVNSWKPKRSYDVVLAFQSLHHFVELELLFDKIHRVLSPDGYFMADDMIGRNGHQRWPEALKFVEEFWRELPDKYKYNQILKR